MPPMNRGGFSKVIAPGFRKVVFMAWKERPVEGTKLVNMNTSKRAYEDDFEVAGLGTLQAKTEGGSVQYQDGKQGGTKRYTHSTWALGFRITEELYDDDLYNIFGTKFSKSLAKSSRNNLEIVMHAPYNNAFSTSYPGFTSGEALCSTSHTLIRGGTAANRPATDVDLDIISFQAAMEHFGNLLDEEGMPCMIIPKILVHSAGDQWIATQMLKSTLLPGSNQNDINPVASLGIVPHLSHYLTDTDAWFLLGDQHDVNFFERRPFKFSNTDDFDTGDAKFKGSQRNSSGWGEWRGVYGSSGG